jgi:CHAD domain-containing protein
VSEFAVAPEDPAREAVRASLTRNVVKLHRHETGIRAGNPDSVRKLRIAARRLRSDLSTFRPLLDPDWARALSDDLKGLARSVAGARDREVTLHRLVRDAAALPAGAPRDETLAYVQSVLATELATAHEFAAGALRAEHPAALLQALRDAAENPRTNALADDRCRTVLPPLVARSYGRLAKQARRLPTPGSATHPEADDAWHEARLRAKRARYAADACVPVFGEPSRDLALRLREVTRCLGEHQDAAVAAAAAIGLGRRPDCPAPVALGLGLLHGVQRDAVFAARARFAQVWPEVRPYARAHERIAP